MENKLSNIYFKHSTNFLEQKFSKFWNFSKRIMGISGRKKIILQLSSFKKKETKKYSVV